MKVAGHFVARWQVFWATTYTFDLSMFDGFWFGRLGDPPLNATILADERRLTRVWEGVAPGELWRLRRVNRDYLVRGVPSGGAFHPKTYFFANEREGVLLVGSGNLGARGLDEGHEVFCQFDARTEEGLSTLRAWRDWMDVVVRRLDDAEASARWIDAKRRTPWLDGPAGPSLFVSNWDRSLLDQLCEGIAAPVDELHVMAPFYDERASALESLIDRVRPRAISIYACKGMSVDGASLVRILEASGATTLVLRSDEFVHAKLLGIRSGDRSLLLSGSANLSRAALLAVATEGAGNVEAGILVELPVERMLASFSAPDLPMSEVPSSSLVDLNFTPSPEPTGSPVVLLSASLRPDASVEVRTRGTPPDHAQLTNGVDRHPLVGGRAIGPFSRTEDAPLVWITDRSAAAISNKVPLDDPKALRRFMSERDHRSSEVPLLDIRDLNTPVGQMLERLHRACIFDIDDTPAARSIGREQQQEDGDEADFWERLLKEELRLDPRCDRYAVGIGHDALPLDGDLFGLLAMMRDQVPGPPHLRAVGDERDAPAPETPGQRWSPEKRLQVRLFNVLDRWCRALGDARLRWLGRTAPVRNYHALLVSLIECWVQGFLPEDRLVTLAETLLGTFIGTDRRRGYLLRLDAPDLDETMSALKSTPAPSAAAAICYVALRPALKEMQSYLFEWQAFLAPGIERGFIVPDDRTVELVETILGVGVTLEEIEARLLWAATYLDDAHWCTRTARALGLEEIRLTADHVNPKYGVTLEVWGLVGGAADPRLVTVVHQAFRYRRVKGAVVSFDGNRVSVATGEPVHARIGGSRRSSGAPVTEELLSSLEKNGVGLDALLAGDERRAS